MTDQVCHGQSFDVNIHNLASPMLTNRGFKLAAEKSGAEFLFRSEVSKINTENVKGKPTVTGVTLKSGEIIDAPIVVDACGKYSPSIQPTPGA